MKKFWNVFWAGLVLFSFLLDSAPATQIIPEVKAFLEDSSTQGTPDPNNSFVWPIDLFSENIDPVANGWQIKTGTGILDRRLDTIPDFYFTRVTPFTTPFRVQFPHDTLPKLNSRKNHILLNLRSVFVYDIELKVRVTTGTPGDTVAPPPIY